jgi:tripartite-type tricarboxylate transporter receptor subunit TctC
MRNRRDAMHLIARHLAALWVALGSAFSFAQAYPAKPVRLIAPFPPGGSSDLIARILSARMAEGLGQQIIVDNRPGASSNLGTQVAAKAPPDGYTLLIASVTATINTSLYQRLGFDLMKDFAPVAKLANGPIALVVHPSVPARSVQELIKLAQARPGHLNYGSGGSGTPAHISGEMFNMLAKVKVTHVPYKGTGMSVTDLIAGQIHMVFASMPVVFPHMKSGRVRTLAMTGAKRTPLAADIPTIAESGLPGYALDSWWGILTNAAVPPPIIATLSAELRRVLQLPDVKDRFADLGIDPAYAPPADLGNLMRAEIERFAELIRKAGIRAE